MADVTIEEITNALQACLTAADSTAVVVPYEADGTDSDGDEESFDVEALRPNGDGARVHGWAFCLRAIGRKNAITPDYTISGTTGKKARVDVTFAFTVRFFLEYQHGTNAANAKRTAQDTWQDVCDYLSARPRLGLDNERLRGHSELQCLEITRGLRGQTNCFEFVGRLDVLTYNTITYI